MLLRIATPLFTGLVVWSSAALPRASGTDPHREETFTSSERCAVCHATAPGAQAMLSAGYYDAAKKVPEVVASAQRRED